MSEKKRHAGQQTYRNQTRRDVLSAMGIVALSGLATVGTASADGAEFQITSVDPDSIEVGPGDSMDVTVEIENVGSVSDSAQVELRIGGAEFWSQQIVVPRGETVALNMKEFEPAAQLSPSEYEPEIWTEDDTVSMQLTVVDADGELGDDADDADPADEANGPADEADDADDDGPGFGVPAALAGLGGAGYILKRRRSDEA